MNDALISRSALIVALENEKIRIAVDKVKMFGLIEAAPAVDAVEVLRCGECRFWNRHIGRADSPNGYCRMHEETMNSYDFCSYGERSVNDPYSRRA